MRFDQRVGDITINSKKLFAVIAIFLLTTVLSAASQEVSQGESVLNSSAEIQQETPDTTDESQLLITETDETQLPLQDSRGGLFSGIWVFLRMILVLAIVLVLIWLLFKFLKKNSLIISDDDKFLRRAASVSLGPGKSVQIITLIDKAYLVGVTDSSINLISEIQDTELINALNLYADKTQNASKPKNFTEILELFMPNASKGQPDQTNVFEDSKSEQILNSLRKRTSNLNEGAKGL